MPITFTNQGNGITKSHIAERLQINLLAAKENVQQMKLEVYFNVDTYLNGEKITETYWDNTPLIFDCENDPELEAAMLVVQNRIGVRRYEQITAPQPEVVILDPPPSL